MLKQPRQFEWRDEFLLGYPEMDRTHREFVQALSAMLGCKDEDFLESLDAFIRHADAHFGEEDEWMRTTQFPPQDCHIEEHAAVMASVHAVRALVQEGDIAEGRRLAEALADWFPKHAFHLDSALSHWMVKRKFGGKPVVFRRSAVQREA